MKCIIKIIYCINHYFHQIHYLLWKYSIVFYLLKIFDKYR
ncbi:unnamed protein product [Schistosoma curassoni]|uniref:Uncharacterized protein n=1 Tax=Schistosoma curassoni TaxID=6186 RepID=A0A183KE38_9TREM|nr:unnamed protein product [Schistosoma curassoni]